MLLEVKDSTDRAATVAMLRSVEPHAVDGSTAEELAEGCTLLDIFEDERPVGAYAVEINGQKAFITAAASLGEASFRSLHLLEDMLRRAGVREIELVTKRVGLIHRMWNAGYSVRECAMQKEI